MTLIKVKGNGSEGLSQKSSGGLLGAEAFKNPNILDFSGGTSRFGLLANVPAVNTTENEKDFKIEMAAPGLEKKDFKIETDNKVLTISSEKKEEKKEEKSDYSRREFSYQSFCRSFQIPENSLPDKIDAKYENGILTLIIPKKEPGISNLKKTIKIS